MKLAAAQRAGGQTRNVLFDVGGVERERRQRRQGSANFHFDRKAHRRRRIVLRDSRGSLSVVTGRACVK